jgi:hypothetical protein
MLRFESCQWGGKKKSPRPALDLQLNNTSQILPEIQPMHRLLRLEVLRTNAKLVRRLRPIEAVLIP